MPSKIFRISCVAALLLSAMSSSGCVPYVFRGKQRAAMMAPPASDTATAIKAKETHDKTTASRDDVKPLMDAVMHQLKPSGCWACTVETTVVTSRANKPPTTTLVRFHPDKPPGQLFEILAINGLPPSEQKKDKLAARMLRNYERDLKHQRRSQSMLEQLVKNLQEGACYMEHRDNILKYTIFVGEKSTFGMRYEYEVDINTGALVSYSKSNLHGFRIVGLLTVSVEISDVSGHYMLVEGSPAPRLQKSKDVFKGRSMGVKTEFTAESTYSDYEKVPCYDTRFSESPKI